jgi:membrane protein DedA with SNARE-associated domain
MSVEQLITQYGYFALLIGTFLEGETIVVIAGVLAQRGFFELPLVIMVAFLGTFVADQFFFYLGRFKGRSYLQARPHWQRRADRVLDLLHRHQLPVIIGFRFLYGFRSVTPFIIGSSGFNPIRFAILNAFGTLIWAGLIGTLGYTFGRAVAVMIEKYDVWLLGAVVLAAVLVLIGYRFRRPLV